MRHSATPGLVASVALVDFGGEDLTVGLDEAFRALEREVADAL